MRMPSLNNSQIQAGFGFCPGRCVYEATQQKRWYQGRNNLCVQCVYKLLYWGMSWQVVFVAELWTYTLIWIRRWRTHSPLYVQQVRALQPKAPDRVMNVAQVWPSETFLSCEDKQVNCQRQP